MKKLSLILLCLQLASCVGGGGGGGGGSSKKKSEAKPLSYTQLTEKLAGDWNTPECYETERSFFYPRITFFEEDGFFASYEVFEFETLEDCENDKNIQRTNLNLLNLSQENIQIGINDLNIKVQTNVALTRVGDNFVEAANEGLSGITDWISNEFRETTSTEDSLHSLFLNLTPELKGDFYYKKVNISKLKDEIIEMDINGQKVILEKDGFEFLTYYQLKSEIQGTWQTEDICLYNENLSVYNFFEINFEEIDEETFNVVTEVYSYATEEDCLLDQDLSYAKYSINQIDISKASNGVDNLDLKISDLAVYLETSSNIFNEAANNSDMCGFNDWVVGEIRDVSQTPCGVNHLAYELNPEERSTGIYKSIGITLLPLGYLEIDGSFFEKVE